MSETGSRTITIPTVGSVLTLTQPWVLSLHHEYRNSKLIEALGLKRHGREYGRELSSSQVVFPIGTKLVVDRIYIRKGKSDYDSITFVLRKGGWPDKPKLSGRFWAKLGDVNYITCEWAEDTLRLDSKVHPLVRLAAEAECGVSPAQES